MSWLIDFLFEMRAVFLTIGILFLILSYAIDNFNYLGGYYIAGVIVTAFAIVVYMFSFFKKV